MKFFDGFFTQGINQIIGKGFTIGVNDIHVRILLFDLIFDGHKQMGLSKTAGSVDKKRIIRLNVGIGIHRHRFTGSVGEFIFASHNEVVKGIFVFTSQKFLFDLLVRNRDGRRRSFNLLYSRFFFQGSRSFRFGGSLYLNIGICENFDVDVEA